MFQKLLIDSYSIRNNKLEADSFPSENQPIFQKHKECLNTIKLLAEKNAL